MIKFFKILLVFVLVFTVAFCTARINTRTPVGTIRYECFKQGHIISALFLEAEKTELERDDNTTVYKVIKYVPYEKATKTYLDYWNVIKNKNNKYSASYGAA